MGMLHPETVYDDPYGQPLRKELFKRLRYHFQYRNEFCLFAEVSHTRKYSTNIYGGLKNTIKFDNINNLFHPSTIDASYCHNGFGKIFGIKDPNGNWNITAHKNRIVTISSSELCVLRSMFNENESEDSVSLTSIHSKEVMNVLAKMSVFKGKLKHCAYYITQGLNETEAVDKGVMTKEKMMTFLTTISLYIAVLTFMSLIRCIKASRCLVIDIML